MQAEILTMINTKGVRLDGVGGGMATITTADLNAALSYCNTLGLNMLISRVCGDESADKPAYIELQREIKKLATRWRLRDDNDRVKELAMLAIYETNKNPVCPTCKGRKFNRLQKPCAPCKGTGRYILKDSHRAKAIDVAHSTWSRVWSSRYSEVLQLISEKESLALRQLNKRIGQH